MKNRVYKKPLSILLAMVMVVSSMLSLPMVAHAVATPQELESYLLNCWADPENTLTQQDIDDFSAGTKTTMVGGVAVHKRSKSSSNYYLFLPSNADCNNLRFWFTASSASITVDGTTTNLVNGETTDALSSINDGGVTKSCTLTLDGNNYTVTAIKSGDVGAVYIDTESGSISSINSSSDHSVSEAGTVLVIDADGNVCYDGVMDKMSGRGNGTWDTENEKNPYNFKLAKSTSLLGMSKAKKWVLLANNNDTSLIKNQLSYDFSKYIGVEYQPTCKPVDLYVNQQYFGSYQLSEKVEIKSGRIDITDAYENLENANTVVDETTGESTVLDLKNAPTQYVNASGSTLSTTSSAGHTVGVRKYSTNFAAGSSSDSGLDNIFGNTSSSTGDAITEPDDYTGGYLYELEISNRWVDENAGFCAYNRQGWVIKSCDVATKNMVDYSYDLLYALGSSVYNKGVVPSSSTTTKCSKLGLLYYSSRTTTNPAPATEYQGKKWSDILDANSAVKYYWTQEYFKNMDSSTSSTYFYKDSDSVDTKLYAGPVWDLDNAIGYEQSGSRWGYSWTSSSGWYTKNTRIYRFTSSDTTTSYSSDDYAPLSFYGALATNCSDFWTMAESYWYTDIQPATEILLGNEIDPSGVLHSTEYYVNTVAKSNTMDNLRLNLNSDAAWDYSSMISGINTWFSERNTFINGEISTVDISNASFSTIGKQTCTGNEITPDFTLTYNGTTLRYGIDYTVEYSNNIAASTNATITVTGQGYYTGTNSTTFTISSGTLSDGTVSIPQTACVGDTLDSTVTNASGENVNQFVTYQWFADGTAISGATDSTYVVADSDKGKTITLKVAGDGSNIASLELVSNECVVSANENENGITQTIAAWDYDYTADSTALVNADETGTTYYYTATSGENTDGAKLTASVNVVDNAKIKWSGTDDIYENTSTTLAEDQTPVMGTSKTDGLAWGEYPYFETVVSTANYKDITVSAKLGGTKKAPRSWKLQYSLDGVNYTDVEGATYTITDNKVMEVAFEDSALPTECNNKDNLYIRFVVCENLAINGSNTIVGSTSGDAAVNNIAIKGVTTKTIETLNAPVVTTDAVDQSQTIFSDENVVISDTNGGAQVLYSVNGGEYNTYELEFNPFNSNSKIGDTATISAYAIHGSVKSDVTTIVVTNGGVNVNSFRYTDYSADVLNGAVASNGGVYDESGRMSTYTDGVSQYVPLYKASNGAYCISPDDGALWSEDSGFYFEVSTAGFEKVAFTCQAYTTAQGPNSVSLQYSLDGENWATVKKNVTLSANAQLENLFETVSLPTECDNLAKLYVRLATTENLKNNGLSLWNNDSKGNLYINNVVISGENSDNVKMPYTNKSTNYFGSGSIEYISPDSADMQCKVTDANGNTMYSGEYVDGGIVISTLDGFNSKSSMAYTVSVWAVSDGKSSVVNTKDYYYKGETVTKFSYNSTKRLLENYLNEDLTQASNTSGANVGTLSIYPNGVDASTLTYTGTYGVKASWSTENPFVASKDLDNPDNNGFWLVKTSTLGYTDLTITLEQLSSNKGPRDWGLAYSTDGVTYTYVENSNVRAISNDSSTSTVETYNNFALPQECDNQENLYIKVFINGGESVDGTEIELLTKGNTGINAIEINGIEMPSNVDVTINTVAYESLGLDNALSVDSTIVIDGETYNTVDGQLTINLVEGETYTAYASTNGTFVNAVEFVAGENNVEIAVVSIDLNGDGVINGKDFAQILKIKDATTKDIYVSAFSVLANTRESNFSY